VPDGTPPRPEVPSVSVTEASFRFIASQGPLTRIEPWSTGESSVVATLKRAQRSVSRRASMDLIGSWAIALGLVSIRIEAGLPTVLERSESVEDEPEDRAAQDGDDRIRTPADLIDSVQEADEESFPASDAPSSWAGGG
jgi:hypothetical protein